jgi:hypothetical protein
MIQRTLLFLSLLLLAGQICHGEIQDPTHSDLRYSGDYNRSQLDLWLADSKKPTPLVVNFHGGGFRKGR